MLPPKPKSEISIINDLIAQITPYLQGDATYSEFTRRRIEAQIEGINDPYFYKAVKYYFLFSVGDSVYATMLAEETVSERPQDVIAWRNYVLCSLYTVGLEGALELVIRAAEVTNAPRMVRDAFYYARGLGDFKTFEKYLKKYSKMVGPDFCLDDEDNDSLPLAIEQAELAINSGLADVVAGVGKMMNALLKPSEQLDGLLSFYIMDDDESSTYVLEITPPNITPEKCAELSLELIKIRAEAGEVVWDVVGIFTTEATTQRN